MKLPPKPKKIAKKNKLELITTEKDYSRLSEEIKQNFECIEVDLEIENKTLSFQLRKNRKIDHKMLNLLKLRANNLNFLLIDRYKNRF